jgi:DNA repair protein RadA/Sms
VSKTKQQYICRTCGSVHPRWLGRCPDCGTWDSLEPQTLDASAGRDPQQGLAALPTAEAAARPLRLPDIDLAEVQRLPSGIGELDRVLGGGIVPGATALLGGHPGIGKSTLMLQAAGELAKAGKTVLYVSSEESPQQLRLRAERLGIHEDEHLYILADTNLARIVEAMRKLKPALSIIDSIQMIYKSDLGASPGSVSQLRRCVTELVYLAKLDGAACVLVGHVVKDGSLAGPKLAEHIVDVVLSFEGDRYHAHRIVRGIKNRFGSTLEIGLFEMTGQGLVEAPHAIGSAIEDWDQERPGTTVCPVLLGSRCALVELQALTATAFPGSAKRKAAGLDSNRLAMIVAVLEQHGGLRLADRDIFASSAGGFRIAEPAADLALALSLASAHLKKSLPPHTAVVGEVGLGGEVRAVPQLEQRLREAERLGAKLLVAPPQQGLPKNNRVQQVRSLGQALEVLR